MKPAIHDRGRGPEIVGSRITVYDVLASTQAGRSIEELAREWRLSVEQIETALQYIEAHRSQVERDWAEIQEQNAKERAESTARVSSILEGRKPSNSEIWEKFQQAKAAREARHARSSDRRESPGTNGTHPEFTRESGVE